MPTPIKSNRLGPAPTKGTGSAMSQGELKTLYTNRPTSTQSSPGMFKDVNLKADKPKAISSPKKMGR